MGSLERNINRNRKIIKVQNQVVAPHSVLIEKTALDLATTYYEVGRSQGLHSKHKDARKFAKANVEKYIPMAVKLLMDMLGNPATPNDQKDMIYDALMERSNDPDLSDIGIPAFINNAAFTSDRVEKVEPLIINTGAKEDGKEKIS